MSNSVDIKAATKWFGLTLAFLAASGGAGFGGSYIQSDMRVDQAVMAEQMSRLTDVVENGFERMSVDSKDFRDVQSIQSTDIATLLAGQEELKRRMALVENHVYRSP